MRALDRSPTKRFLTVRQFVDEVSRVGHGEVIELKSTMADGPRRQAQGRARADAARRTRHAVRRIAALAGARPYPEPAVARAAGHAPRRCQPPTIADRAAVRRRTAASGAVATRHRRRRWRRTGRRAARPHERALAVGTAWRRSLHAATRRHGAQRRRRRAGRRSAGRRAAVGSGRRSRAGKTKRGGASDDGKGKFRETMWFKKGDLDAQAAVAAAEERARTGKDVGTDKADSQADRRALQRRRLDHARRQGEVQPAHRRDADDAAVKDESRARARAWARSPRTR